MNRIVCVGNRYDARDAAGPAVLDCLAQSELPPGLELRDGGLAGLDLLPMVEDAQRVVFVDSVQGYASPGTVVVLDAETAAQAAPRELGHAAGLAGMLRMMPAVCGPRRAEVLVVGIEAPHTLESVQKAARTAVALALGCSPGDAQ